MSFSIYTVPTFDKQYKRLPYRYLDKSEKASLPDKELKELVKSLPKDDLEGENAT
jgi:hypothetical protein